MCGMKECTDRRVFSSTCELPRRQGVKSRGLSRGPSLLRKTSSRRLTKRCESFPPVVTESPHWLIRRQPTVMSGFCPQVTRPHPGDNPLLILFLVGGVTASELRLVKEVVSTHKPGSQVCQHGWIDQLVFTQTQPFFFSPFSFISNLTVGFGLVCVGPG